MKKNRLLKYSLMTILTFIGLFVIDASVDAKEITCNYSYDFTYKRVGKRQQLVDQTDTNDFQLVLSTTNYYNSSNASEYYMYTLKQTGKFSIVGLPEGSGNMVVLKGSLNECPTVTLYQRRTSFLGFNQYNISKFYLLNSYGIEAGNISYYDYLTNGCSGKSATEEFDGYLCGNLITVSGTRAITTCGQEEIKEIKAALDSKFSKVVTKFDSVKRGVFTTRIDASDKTTKEEAEAKCSPLLDKAENYADSLEKEFNNLSLNSLILEEAENKYCTLNDDDSIYSGYVEKLKNYKDILINEGEHAKISCINTAKISSEDKEDLNDDTKKEAQAERKENEKEAQSSIREYADLISDIDLGGSSSISCEGLFGPDLLDLIERLLNYVKIAAPILLLVLGSVDFGQAVLTDDKDALKKATSKFVKRAIICVAIFFLPTLINYILSFIEGMTADPLCGIK